MQVCFSCLKMNSVYILHRNKLYNLSFNRMLCLFLVLLATIIRRKLENNKLGARVCRVTDKIVWHTLKQDPYTLCIVKFLRAIIYI